MNPSVQQHRVRINPLTVSSGESVGEPEVECCLWGDRSLPVVVLMGGISANRWALDAAEHSGWWRDVVNDHGALNTRDYCFLTFEYLSLPAAKVEPVPLVTTSDQAQVLRNVQQQLDLPQFHAVIGASYGGMVALAFAARYPNALQRLVCIAAAHNNAIKTKALRWIQRQIMALGQRHANHEVQAEFTAVARALAMIGYRGELEWQERFSGKQPGADVQAMDSYLQYHGQRFAARFCPHRYAQLSQSIDFHQVDVTAIEAKSLLIGFTSDQMVSPAQLQQLQQQIPGPATLHLVNSIYGHDGFLLEAEALNPIFHSFFNEQNHDHIERNHRRASGY